MYQIEVKIQTFTSIEEACLRDSIVSTFFVWIEGCLRPHANHVHCWTAKLLEEYYCYISVNK